MSTYAKRDERLEADWNRERDRRQAAEAEVERLTERAEAAEAALARVEALAEEWERKAGPESNAWSAYGPQSVSVPFAVQQIRAAMQSEP